MIALGFESNSETQYLKIGATEVKTLTILPNLNKRWDIRPHKGHKGVTIP